jgi:UPF0716 protein FxsA
MSTGLTLVLLFTVVPAVETWLLVTIGSRIGAAETVAYLLLMGVLGAWLGKRAGGSVMRQVSADLQRGVPPADRLVEAALVLVGSVLLVTPGVLSDLTGTLLFIGPVRRWLAPRVKQWALTHLNVRGVFVGSAGPGPGAPDGWRQQPEPPRPERSSRKPAAFDHPTQE